MKKRLSDITNLHSQHKSPFKNQENSLPALYDSSTKSYIDQLLKENAIMVKLVEEKDKIIESNGIEVQKLRVNLRTTQLQNWHLAQSNSQMLAELNMAKDRLKTLQHEFVSKDALFKAMTLELKEGKTKSEETAVEQQSENNDNKQKASKPKRGRTTRSQSMGPTTSRPAVDKESVETKRRCLRRQSVRFKPPVIEVSNNLLDQTTDSSHCKSPDVEECVLESSKSKGAQRSSIGRPLRRVTEKVVSYKDPPLNTKMRRTE